MNKEKGLRIGQRMCEKSFRLFTKGAVLSGITGFGIALLRDYFNKKKN